MAIEQKLEHYIVYSTARQRLFGVNTYHFKIRLGIIMSEARNVRFSSTPPLPYLKMKCSREICQKKFRCCCREIAAVNYRVVQN